ncbi:hypothetical protein H4R18_005914 [Coemansia javaensis]|uniref:Uncharacterized protein n=1 Tax=Coemansia javaensis TaxID=2761396 RepID=A0A9W8LE64_9FUNG|nr:hypothetical protein H4R18_005914 [Coemansia javaensis]
MHMAGKVAVVTGAARGLGRRLAERIVEAGGRVVLGDVLDEQGAAAAAALNAGRAAPVAVYQHCDVTRSSELAALVARAEAEFGALDIMVNNAGIAGMPLWADEDGAAAARTIAINLAAPVEGTRLAVAHFRRAGRPGCVVNTASMMAFFPTEFGPVYGATKSALVNLTAACAPLAQRDPPIRVNAVAPNYADTDMAQGLVAAAAGLLTVDEVVDQMVRCIEDESLAGDTIKIVPGRPPRIHDGRKAPKL